MLQAVRVARGGIGIENDGDGDVGGKRKDEIQSVGDEDDEWVQEVVRLLDMAVIMTGAPGREETVEKLLSALGDYLRARYRTLDQIGPPRKKRRKILSDFPTVLTAASMPHIANPIPARSALSLPAFEKHLTSARPLVITDALTHWPALHERSWQSLEYLLHTTLGGRRLVPVEVGKSYTDTGWGQQIVTFRDFMEDYMLCAPSKTELSGGKAESKGAGYLAQHDLFSQIPRLRNDISVPDYCYSSPPPPAPGTPLASEPPQAKLEEPLLNAWFGPAGTVSPLHTDPYHNILCQVVGKKYVRLYAPEETKRVYPKSVENGVQMSNTSEVDIEAVDERAFPAFRDAKFIETVLGEGECLYIPVGWWHYVKSLTTSFSVSFWWN